MDHVVASPRAQLKGTPKQYWDHSALKWTFVSTAVAQGARARADQLTSLHLCPSPHSPDGVLPSHVQLGLAQHRTEERLEVGVLEGFLLC